jgi:hypothetical protein
MKDESEIECCQGVDGPCAEPAKLRRQNTSYNDEERNWVKMCDGCFEHNQKHWADMWADLNGSRLQLELRSRA